MKKFLLFAVAALIVGSASAQLHRPANVKMHSNRVVSKGDVKTMKDVKIDVSKATPLTNLMAKDNMKKAQSATPNMKSLKAVHSVNALTNTHRAELKQKYMGKGRDYDTNASLSWDMLYTTDDNGAPVLVDVIPLPEAWAELEHIGADITLEGNKITIKPQKVVQGTAEDGSTMYYYLHSWASEDGSIVITVNEDGTLTTIDKEDIAYSAFSEDRFDLSKDAGIYKGYFLDATDVKYYTEDQKVVPVAAYEPETLFLHPGPNVNGNYYTNLLMPVYADINLINGTDVLSDSYAWSVQKVKYNSATQSYDPVGDAITGNEENFSFYAESGSYSPATLVATLNGESSEPFQWNNASWYAGGSADDWDDGESPLLTFTKANPNGTGLTLGVNPKGAKSTIFYQGKPASPLYFTGISLFVYNFSKTANKTLNFICKIHKAHRDENGKFVLGELIAQADLTDEGIERGTWMSDQNLVKLNWTQFYVEDEFGMSEDVDYLLLDEGFAVVFEGWDNGTFSGSPLMFTSLNPKAVSNNYAIIPGEDTYTKYGWSTNAVAFVGFIDAIYGYLHTTDNTDLVIPAEGGKAAVHVEPMFYANDDEGNPTTGLWLADDSDEADWLQKDITNEVYTSEESSFDMVFAADALPEGVTGRKAHLVFEQWGGKLEVNVTQGEATGISVTVKKVENNTPAYNLAGQRVNSGYKGLVIKNGRKFMNK